MTVDERIGANVHELMWLGRRKQKALYEAMGVSRMSLHRKLRGESAWTAQDIEKAAEVLGVEPGSLFAVTHGYQSDWGMAA